MEITFLGTGTAMPTGERFQTGLLLESGTDSLLVDCGSGALHGLARTETGYEDIDALLLTHHHWDHVSDIDVLLQARWLAGEESLPVYGPAGTRELLDGILGTHEEMRDRLDLPVTELDPEDAPFEIAGFGIDAMWTRHSMDCLAYRFEAGGAPFVFSGDSEAFEELIEFADGAAVLAHDCSFPDDVDVSNHPTPATLGETLASADAEVGRVYLTHLYPHTDGRHEEMLDSIGDSYDGEVRFAHDGLQLDISKEN
jgi:ribonuclease BN (tRNA processing enzyme)